MAPAFGLRAACALLAGIVCALLAPRLPALPWLAVAFATGFAGWVSPTRWRHAGIAVLGFGLAGLHAASALGQQLPPRLEQEMHVIVGRVGDLPRREARRTRFRFDVEGGSVPALRGRSVQLAWYDDYGSDVPGPRMRLHAGERWRFKLKLRAPRGLRNPGGFDSERHALAERIAATGYVRAPDEAVRLSMANGVVAWRERMSRRIALAVDRPSSRFLRALALGDSSALSEQDWEVLRASGLTHLIAISGFHVGLVAGFVALVAGAMWRLLPTLCRRVPRQVAAGGGAIMGGLAYAAVAGFALPTVRTLLMIVVVVAARGSRRPQPALHALGLAAMAMLLVDPLSPLAPGFWLSFVGVAWLMWCLPHGDGGPLRDFASAQAVASVGLLPLTVALFGQASLAGPFANVVAVPLWSLVVVPLALLGTLLDALHAGMGDWAWSASAAVFAWSWPWFEWLARAPFAFWWLPEARWFALPLALTGAFWLLMPRGVPGRLLAPLLWLPLLLPARGLPRHGEVELLVVDVGQGLSVVVRTARHVLLYDMGPAIVEGYDAGERAVVPALQALGVRRIDAMVVSHADADHVGGLAAVSRAFPGAALHAPPGSPVAGSLPCLAGDAWHWDGVVVRVLHPPRHFPYLRNESSCVLRIETQHGVALLTGDVGEVVESRLVRANPRDVRADVVVVAHHGSGGSSGEGFVVATGARHALISAGYANRFGHPRALVVERWRDAGAGVSTTSDTGALRVRLSEAGVDVSARRSEQPRMWDAVRRHAREAGLSYRPD